MHVEQKEEQFLQVLSFLSFQKPVGQSLTHLFSIVRKVSTVQAVHLVGDCRHFEQGGLQGLQVIREESAQSPSGQVLRHLNCER